jgi:hypothetical protein
MDEPGALPWQSGLARGKGLEFLAGLEANGFAGRDADLLTSARIAANAGFPRLHGKDSEAAKLDAFAAAERVLHGLEDGFDGLLGFGAGDAGLLYDGVDNIELYHANPRHSGTPC